MDAEILVTVPAQLFKAMQDVTRETGVSVAQLAAEAFQREIGNVMHYHQFKARFAEVEKRFVERISK